MSKIVVLNSGGFDSICLINYLVKLEEYPKEEVYSLHFNYGELNKEEQNECVRKVCEKLGVHSKTITLPTIDWSKSDFYTEGVNEYETQYLEYRNLIFLSYALSYAQSIGANKIFLAILGIHGYTDTSDTFFNGLNYFSKPLSDIEIVRPFKDCMKDDLIPYAVLCGIQKGDYFSCDTPINGKPCGKCGDCKDLKEIENTLKIDHPHKVLFNNNYNYLDPNFTKTLKGIANIKEVRLLINNSCQLNCKHCFYGFKDTLEPVLPKETLYNSIVEAEKLGVENIHFSGKEPLFNDDILWYAHKIKEENLKLTFDIVTNGINVPKYAKELKECGLKKFYLSVDDILNSQGVRNVHGITEKALEVCGRENIDTEIFIDLHSNNYFLVKDIAEYLLSKYSCIKAFYIRTIRHIGKGVCVEYLTSEALNDVFLQVKSVAKKYKDIIFNYYINLEYFDKIKSLYNELAEALETLSYNYSTLYYGNFGLILEEFCSRYVDTITITPDGYVLGCASEISVPNYRDISVGNIKKYPLSILVNQGIEKISHLNDMYCTNCTKKCSFLM